MSIGLECCSGSSRKEHFGKVQFGSDLAAKQLDVLKTTSPFCAAVDAIDPIALLVENLSNSTFYYALNCSGDTEIHCTVK